MKRIIALLLALLCLFTLTSCATNDAQENAPAEMAGSETAGEKNASAESASMESDPAESPAPSEEPTAAEIRMDGTMTVDEVMDYLEKTLPCDEELIPYVGDIYYAGDCALEWYLFGFCTSSGEIVTEPVFSNIRQFDPVGDAWPEGAEELYACGINNSDEKLLYSSKGEYLGCWSWNQYEQVASQQPESGLAEIEHVYKIVNDGVYYLDGCTFESCDPVEDGVGHYHTETEPMRNEDGLYMICRLSDGEQVAVSEFGLNYCDTASLGRVYFTKANGMVYTYDSQFNLLLQIPAVGARSSQLFIND